MYWFIAHTHNSWENTLGRKTRRTNSLTISTTTKRRRRQKEKPDNSWQTIVNARTNLTAEYWPQSHNDFVQKMLRKARKGAKVIYVPGNHDEFLRSYYGTHFGGIDVMENTIHNGVDGKRYLVIHGDIFDLVVQNARWLAHLGDKAYDFAIQMNRLVNFFRRLFGVPYGRCRNGPSSRSRTQSIISARSRRRWRARRGVTAPTA